jgi:hypothetical protein
VETTKQKGVREKPYRPINKHEDDMYKYIFLELTCIFSVYIYKAVEGSVSQKCRSLI